MSPIVINTTNTDNGVDSRVINEEFFDELFGKKGKSFTSEDIAGKEKGTYDVSILDYNFDGNNQYATNHSGVEIDGFLFFPEEVGGDESYNRREFKRTDIMSGGQFMTRGKFVPRKFSFNTSLDIDPDNPDMYDKVFEIMENKVCEIVSPYMGGMFKGTVEIDKTHPKASPGALKLSITIEEAVDPSATTVGDSPIKYPSTTKLGSDVINVRDIKAPEDIDEDKAERDQIRDDWLAKSPEGGEFQNPYTNNEE